METTPDRADTPAERAATPAPAPTPPAAAGGGLTLAHHGVAGELFAITLTNLLLKVVTLGVYHFWAKTRVRSYVWSRTRFAGEPFEYTGRGLELFIGYLIAMVVVVPLFVGWQYLTELFVEQPAVVAVLMLAFYPLLLFLTGFATFSSRRYLLSRTRWRGIRLGLSGSRGRHGVLMLVHSLLTFITSGFYWPIMRNVLTKHIIENTWLGDRRFRYEGKGGELFERFIYVILIFIGGFFGFLILMGLAVGGVLYLVPGLLDNLKDWIPFLILGGVVGVYLPLLLGWVVLWLVYKAIEYRYIAEKTFVDDVSFKLDYTIWQFVRFNLANLLLMLFTLSLAFPWVVVRTMRFTVEHLTIAGQLDLESISQHPEGVPRTGEGLAEAFDLGSI